MNEPTSSEMDYSYLRIKLLRRSAIVLFLGVSALVLVDATLEDPWTHVGPVRRILPSLGERGLAQGDSLFALWVAAGAATVLALWLTPARRWISHGWLQLTLRTLVTLGVVLVVGLWLLFIGLRAVG